MPPTLGPAARMNPTTTEHDFRFPRRPTARDKQQNLSGGRCYPAAAMPSRRPNPNLVVENEAASNELLGPSLFPLLKDANSGSDETIAQMQQDDPLATQIWKFFSRTKQELPHQERMENMTWRMMAVQLRKQRQEELQKKYGAALIFFLLIFPLALAADAFSSRFAPVLFFTCAVAMLIYEMHPAGFVPSNALTSPFITGL